MRAAVFFLAACGPGADEVVVGLKTDNPMVREDMAKIARNSGGDEVVAALVGALGDSSEKVRYNAVESLIELEAEDAVPALEKVVESDSSDKVQRMAVDALGRLEKKDAVPTLLSYVDARMPTPPLNAIWALGNLEDSRALPVLAKLRESDDLYIAYNANMALRKLKP